MTDQAVPMVDLRGAIRAHPRELATPALERVLALDRSSSGARTASAWRRSSRRTAATAHACGVANGTDALILALRAYGVGAGRRGRDRRQHVHRHRRSHPR